MSVHVQFETPEDLANKIYDMIDLNKNGRVKKGSNEVTKAAERGTAQFIILAEDVNPPELLATSLSSALRKTSPSATCQVRNSWPKPSACPRTPLRPPLLSWKSPKAPKRNSTKSLRKSRASRTEPRPRVD